MRRITFLFLLTILVSSCSINVNPQDDNDTGDIGNDKILTKSGWLDLSGKPLSPTNEPTISPFITKQTDIGLTPIRNMVNILDSKDYPCILWLESDQSNNNKIYFSRWNGKIWVDAYDKPFGNTPLIFGNENQTPTGDMTMVGDSAGNIYVAWVSSTPVDQGDGSNQSYMNEINFVNAIKIANNNVYCLRSHNDTTPFDGFNSILFSSKHLPLNEYDAEESMPRSFSLPHLIINNDNPVLTWQGFHGVYSETYYYAKLATEGWINWSNEIPDDTSNYCSQKNAGQPDGNIYHQDEDYTTYCGSFTGGKRGFFETGIVDKGTTNRLEYPNNGGFQNVSIAKDANNDYYFLATLALVINERETNPTYLFHYKNNTFDLVYKDLTNYDYANHDTIIDSPNGSIYRFNKGFLSKWNPQTKMFDLAIEPFLVLPKLLGDQSQTGDTKWLAFDNDSYPVVGFIKRTNTGLGFYFARWGIYSEMTNDNVDPAPKTKSNPLSVPYICQTQDLPMDTMGVVNPEDLSNVPPPPHIYGEYACGPTSVGMILAYYGKLPNPKDDYEAIKPLSNPSYGYWVASSEQYPSQYFNNTESRFIMDGSIQKDVYGMWGRLTSHSTDNTGQYYGFDWESEGKLSALLNECGLMFESMPVTINETTEVVNFITNSIDNGWPVLWKSSMTKAGHYIVCTGYSNNNGKMSYYINDPYPWGGKRKEQTIYSFSKIQKENLEGRKLYSIKPKFFNQSADETLKEFFDCCFSKQYEKAWSMVSVPSDYSKQYADSVESFKEMWERSKSHGTKYLEYRTNSVSDSKIIGDSERKVVGFSITTENTFKDDNGNETKQINNNNFGFITLDKMIGQGWKLTKPSK